MGEGPGEGAWTPPGLAKTVGFSPQTWLQLWPVTFQVVYNDIYIYNLRDRSYNPMYTVGTISVFKMILPKKT